MGRGRGRGPRARTSGVQRRVYSFTWQAESTDQPVIQGTFLLSRLWARVLFDSGASHSFIASSVVIELGLEVETLKEPLYGSSPLGVKARIGMMLWLRVGDLGDSTHSGLKDYGHVRVRCHPGDGLVDSLLGRYRL